MQPGSYAHVCSATDNKCVLQMLALMLPQTYNNLMHKTAAVAGNFVPFGTYCLMLSDIVRVVDSTSEPQLLQITVQQLLGGAEQLGQQNQAAPYVLQRLLSDHCSSSYTAALRNALHSMVPVLFMGGHTSDYQSILVQRQSATGMLLAAIAFCCWYSSLDHSSQMLAAAYGYL